jgi:hypothetical protein
MHWSTARRTDLAAAARAHRPGADRVDHPRSGRARVPVPQAPVVAGPQRPLHTDTGKNTARNMYRRQDWYVWKNNGDKASLRNKRTVIVDVCKWQDGDGTTSC